VSGVIKPTSGTVRFDDTDVTGQSPHKLAALGLTRTFQATTVFSTRAVAENCRRGGYLTRYPGFLSAFFGVGRTAAMAHDSEQRIEEVLDWLDLSRVRSE